MEKNPYPTENSTSNSEASTNFEHLPTDLLKVVIKSLSMRDMVNMERAFPFFSRTKLNQHFKNECLERDIQYIAPLELLLIDGYVIKAREQDFATLQNKRIKQVFYTQNHEKFRILLLTDDNQFFFNEIKGESYVFERTYHSFLVRLRTTHKDKDISQLSRYAAHLAKSSLNQSKDKDYIKQITGIPIDEEIKDIQMSAGNVLVLTETGNVYAWGENYKGQLGIKIGEMNTSEKINCFTQVKIMDEQQKVKQIFLRECAAWIVREDEKILACGDNRYGQLGITTDNNEEDDNENGIIDSFTPLNPFSANDLKVKNFLSYNDTSWLITNDNQVFACGDQVFRQFGSFGNNTISESYIDTFKLIEPLEMNEKIKDIVFIGNTTWILTKSGHVFAAGSCYLSPHQVVDLSIDGKAQRENFVLVPGIPDGEKVRKIIAAQCRTSIWVITEQGRVYAWGENDKGHLGTGDSFNKSIFTPIQGIPDDEKVKELIPYTTESNTWVVRESNQIFTCLSNFFYLDAATAPLSLQFIQVKGIPSQHKIREILPSNDFRVFILTDDGQVFTSHADIYYRPLKQPEFVNITPNNSKISKVIISAFKHDSYYIYLLSADKKLYTLDGKVMHDLGDFVFASKTQKSPPSFNP